MPWISCFFTFQMTLVSANVCIQAYVCIHKNYYFTRRENFKCRWQDNSDRHSTPSCSATSPLACLFIASDEWVFPISWLGGECTSPAFSSCTIIALGVLEWSQASLGQRAHYQTYPRFLSGSSGGHAVQCPGQFSHTIDCARSMNPGGDGVWGAWLRKPTNGSLL